MHWERSIFSIGEIVSEPYCNYRSRRRTAGLSWTWDNTSKPEMVVKLPLIRANLYFRVRAGRVKVKGAFWRQAILAICYWRKP